VRSKMDNRRDRSTGRVAVKGLSWSVRTLCVLLLLAAVAGGVSGCGDALADARQLEETGDLQGAIAAYQAVLGDDPQNVEALSGLSVCLLGLKRYDEALSLQEKVIALDDTDAMTRVELGFNYLNHQGRPADALRVLTEAAEIDRSAKNLTFLAQAENAVGDVAGAEAVLKEALTVDPAYEYAYKQLVGLLEDEGRIEEAEQIKEQALVQGIVLQEID
jgi:tetratricopeptide (TPR) repeat protein